MKGRTLISAVVLLSVVAGVALAGSVAAQESTQTANETASVEFDDQQVNGSVTVAAATLPEGGFVAVFNESSGYVGSSDYLEAGTHENVTVELERSFERDQVAYAQAFTDDGDESFTVGNETAYMTDSNATVSDSAYVSSGEPSRTGTDASTGTTTDGTGESTMTTGDAATDDTEEPTGNDGTETSVPGFTAVLALVAVLGAALLARR